jgi:hypothetical protein
MKSMIRESYPQAALRILKHCVIGEGQKARQSLRVSALRAIRVLPWYISRHM